jgi:Domain of unknown function (DUF4160)
VPQVSRFYGITIVMFFDEDRHQGRAHFHAIYAGAEASFDATNASRLGGEMPRRAERMVIGWAREHREELQENWERARRHEPLQIIEPLS